MKNNKGIGIKLYGLIGVTILFVIMISSFTWFGFKDFDIKNKQRLNTVNEYINLINEARLSQVHFKIQVQEWKNILLRGNDPKSFDKYYSQFSEEHKIVQSYISNIKHEMKKQGMDISLADTLLKDHEELYSRYNNALKSYDKNNPESYNIVDNLVKGMDRAPTENMDKLVSSIKEHQNLITGNMIKESYDDTRNFNNNLLIIIAVGTLLIILFSIFVNLTYRRITKFVDQFNSLIDKAKHGDLTIKGEIYNSDELGQITDGFNKFVDGIRDLIVDAKKISGVVVLSSSNIMETTDSVNKSSFEIQNTITDIARDSLKQVEFAEKSNDSIKEIVKRLNSINESTVYISSLAVEAMKTVDNGTESIKNQNEKMNNTKTASNNVTSTIYNLSNKSKEIGDVVEFISTITDQINLLSLNASIEAARAGEYGRGFTVVANEVKKLADLSKESTSKINSLIIDVQDDIEKAVNEVNNTRVSISNQEDSVKIIDESFALINKSVFEVVNKIKEVSSKVSEINENAGNTEGFIGDIANIIEETSKGIEEIAATIEEQSSSIEEVSSSMNNLVELSNSLETSISKFNV